MAQETPHPDDHDNYHDNDHDVLSPASEVGSSVSTASSSQQQYFRKRYNPSTTTRREALEQRFGKSRINSSPRTNTTNSTTTTATFSTTCTTNTALYQSISESSSSIEANQNHRHHTYPDRGGSNINGGILGPQIPDDSTLSKLDDDTLNHHHLPSYRLPARLAPKNVSSTSTSALTSAGRQIDPSFALGNTTTDLASRRQQQQQQQYCNAAEEENDSLSPMARHRQVEGTTRATDNRSSNQQPSTITTIEQQQRPQQAVTDDTGERDCKVDSQHEISKPQHYLSQPQQPPNSEVVRYYRIVYRGVVALLSEPSTTAKRSGAYVSYGEIIASTLQVEVDDTDATRTTAVDTTTTSISPDATGLERLGSAVHSPVLSHSWEQQQQSQEEEEHGLPQKSILSQQETSTIMDTPRRQSQLILNPSTPYASNLSHHHNNSNNNNIKRAIRVDKVLTGGYAIDAGGPGQQQGVETLGDQTPRRENHTHHSHNNIIPVVGPSPLPIADSRSTIHSSITTTTTPGTMNTSSELQHGVGRQFQGPECQGFLFSRRHHIPIAEPLETVPLCESGSFLYKVVSSTPLQILTGPCMDAPKTKAMLLPGTVHEVCLRLSTSSSTTTTTTSDDPQHPVYFLRLSRRRGWVADHKVSSRGSGNVQYIMKEVTHELLVGGGTGGDDCNLSVLSAATSSVATPVSVARRRHRPPRRRRDGKVGGGMDHTPLPRHVGGPSNTPNVTRFETPTTFDSSSALVHANLDKGVMSPSSNVSMLSDEASLEHAHHHHHKTPAGALTPDRSVTRSAASSAVMPHPSFYLMRVNAPRGLKILDAPQFQVNNLIRGNHPSTGGGNASSPPGGLGGSKDLTGQMGNQSIFQTMAGHHSTTLTSKIGNPAIFDSITKARKLPRGSVFESSKRMESSGAFSQGAGLIKLSDNSGWAIVPRQDELDEQYRNYHGALAGIKEGEATRAFEEVGNAVLDDRRTSVYVRVLSRGGVTVSLPPPSATSSDDDNTSPTSSAAGSSAVSAVGSGLGQLTSQESDVTSSVGSSFLDAMFRTPRKSDADHDGRKEGGTTSHQPPRNPAGPPIEKLSFSTVIACGMCIEVEPWIDDADPANPNSHRHEFARLRGGQGWVPRQINGKQMLETISPPEFRFGSFWFRVQAQVGIKVRLGPSKRAPSIKSDDGVYFSFECGEFLRASEVMTVFRRGAPCESYAKLYRNRHTRLHTGHGEVRQLASLTVQSEWVHVFSHDELYLEECATEPRIERHRQGWRYNVVLDTRINVRTGPSFAAETNGVVLLGGESVLINERVTGPGETISWLRLKDGQGWVHNVGRNGEALMIPHSLKHRKLVNNTTGRPTKPGQGPHEDIAYNTIIARLFHSDLPEDTYSSSQQAIRRIQHQR